MLTTEKEGEALAGETWARERMSLSAELPERSLCQFRSPSPNQFLFFFCGGWVPETSLTARRSCPTMACQEKAEEEEEHEEDANKEEDEEGMTLCDFVLATNFFNALFFFFLSPSYDDD